MRPTRSVVVVLAVAAVAGCGDRSRRAEEPARTGAPVKYPVAYAVARGGLPKLAERQLPDAVEGAEVVARSEWESYALLVLSEWLHEQGVDLDPPRSLDAETTALGEAWDVPVFVIAPEHARRFGKRLARLSPDETELRAHYEEFNEETVPHAGDIMSDWLDILRRSLDATRNGRVVVIPVDD